jgi:hypothetical protein
MTRASGLFFVALGALFAQTPNPPTPVFRVTVVSRTIPTINYASSVESVGKLAGSVI